MLIELILTASTIIGFAYLLRLEVEDYDSQIEKNTKQGDKI